FRGGVGPTGRGGGPSPLRGNGSFPPPPVPPPARRPRGLATSVGLFNGGGDMRLAGKVALITGGASGMGQSEATIFAREGACVVVADLLEFEARQVVEKIGAAGGQARFVKLDVTSA